MEQEIDRIREKERERERERERVRQTDILPTKQIPTPTIS